MDHSDVQAYGLWSLVIINSVIFIFFAFSFFKPKTTTDWKTFGAFSAFLVALFIEMYGFPLTIYILAGWLGKYYPQINPLSHESGHLLHTLLGIKGDPHFDPLHILSNILILAGFLLLSASWRVLYRAQQSRILATSGPYKYIRHPQYAAFTLVMIGYLLQWPTIPMLIMFPILVFTYVRLSRKEELAVEIEFGRVYRKYAIHTPRYFPHLIHFSGAKAQTRQT
jgi:protein-S-isoprenylcysteine O-methyltransferase Ste14